MRNSKKIYIISVNHFVNNNKTIYHQIVIQRGVFRISLQENRLSSNKIKEITDTCSHTRTITHCLFSSWYNCVTKTVVSEFIHSIRTFPTCHCYDKKFFGRLNNNNRRFANHRNWAQFTSCRYTKLVSWTH